MVDRGTQYDERDYEAKVNAQDCGDGEIHQYYYNRRNMLQMTGTTKEKITKLYIVSVEKRYDKRASLYSLGSAILFEKMCL